MPSHMPFTGVLSRLDVARPVFLVAMEKWFVLGVAEGCRRYGHGVFGLSGGDRSGH